MGVKGVFCFVLVLDFAALATSLPQIAPLLQPVTATQSSTHAGYSASKCIDGDTTGPDGGFDNRSDDLCHTNKETAPWFALDFGKTVLVNRVEIFNRVSCLETGLKMSMSTLQKS